LLSSYFQYDLTKEEIDILSNSTNTNSNSKQNSKVIDLLGEMLENLKELGEQLISA
jgi:hypothetical protein